MSPLEERVHIIDYMFIHLSCMHENEKQVPYESTTPDFEQKNMEDEECACRNVYFEEELEFLKTYVTRLQLTQTNTEK